MHAEPAATAADGTGPARSRRYALILLAVALGALALDQFTKWLVQSTMELGESIPVIPPVLSWHYILNPGAAFSIGTDVTWVFTLVQATVVVYILAFPLRKVSSVVWAAALGGVLGGAAGNLMDRLFREPSFGMGHVVDFIAVPNFAIFNIADSFVVCSMIVVCVLIFRGIGLDGRKADAAEAGDGTGAPGSGTGGES
ncbi:signal peptidase II [Zafaria sp. Z1313]|uniref:signal peptidase II n=1 Tax=unclassified Zafaria TaxID=2828765 RepID=UPI002E79C22F|nr:signal peptidase II [Zafaria sp. J156]MEE1620279.1 signal peptidase II [Zafaria sp. J156]